MKEFIHKWSNWWILHPQRKQLNDAFEKELNELIEREAALRQPPVVGRSEQLPCDCGVMLNETTIQVYCPKCYKTWKVK